MMKDNTSVDEIKGNNMQIKYIIYRNIFILEIIHDNQCCLETEFT